jgi:hypothetical protein
MNQTPVTIIPTYAEHAYMVSSRTKPGVYYHVTGVGFGTINATHCTCERGRTQAYGCCFHRRAAHWGGSLARIGQCPIEVVEVDGEVRLHVEPYKPPTEDVFDRVGVQ